MANPLRIKAAYRVTKPYMLGYYLLIFVSVFLILGYLFAPLRIGFILRLFPEFYYHISNLCISIIFYLGIGFAWLTQGVAFKHIGLLGVVAVVANVVCETVMGFMNTTDFMDAIFGVVGVAISFTYLAMIYRHGLIPLEGKQAGDNRPAK